MEQFTLLLLSSAHHALGPELLALLAGSDIDFGANRLVIVFLALLSIPKQLFTDFFDAVLLNAHLAQFLAVLAR